MDFLKAGIKKPLHFVSCGQFIADENWSHNERIITDFEIIAGVKGDIFIQQDDKKYVVKPGNILLLQPGHIHFGYAPSKKDSSFYWMHFLCEDQYSILNEKDALTEISPLKATPHMSKLTENVLIPTFSTLENTEKVLIQFKQLIHIARSNYYTSLAKDYYLTAITIELTQQTINDVFHNFDLTSVTSKKFVHILEWIRTNIDKDLTVEEIAGIFEFNPNYLTRLFKSHLGVGVIKYINGMKIAKAKELLCNTNESIKEIAFKVGIGDEKYFMKLFKEFECMTPSKYRNAYNKVYINKK